jgi:glycine/D-amino acid oxidase-like deaminating enzyme
MRTVIVGGGVMGVAIAWHLARRCDPLHEPVALLEKTGLAAGSSGRSGAILRQFYSDRPLVEMARDSLRVYAGLQAATGRAIGFQRAGVLTLAGPERPESLDLVVRNVRLLLSLGVGARLLDAAAIRALVPGIEVSDRALACYEPDGGGVDPVRAVEAFAALAREAGAATRLGVRAIALDVDGGRVRGVRTDHGFVEAARVVVAAGPWSAPLLATAGVELPLSVVRPEQHFLALPPGRAPVNPEARDLLVDSALDRFGIAPERLPEPAHPVILDLERGFYTRCEGHARRTRVGRMDHAQDAAVLDPDRVDEDVGPGFQAWARAALERRLPVYARCADAGSAAGLYTLTPDAQAAIGPWPGVAGLFVVTGFSGHGFKLAPSVGAGVAQLLCGEPVTAYDPAFFAPERFARPGAAASGRAFGL